MAVYDADKNNRSLSPDEIENQERELSKSYNEPGGDKEYARDLKGDGQSNLREQSQAAENEEASALNSRLRSAFDEQGGEKNLYREEPRTGIRGKISGLSTQKKKLGVGVGGGVISLVMTLGGMFGFFNAFKLDHLLSAVDNVSFSRVNSVFDRRSDRWLRTYIALRLGEFNGTMSRNDDDNLYFRSNSVDTNNPLKDWYRTLRSNGFEENVLNKQGIYFTSTMSPDGKTGYAQLTIGDQQKRVDLTSGDVPFTQMKNDQRDDLLAKIDGVTTELFEGPGADSEMRRNIKRVVNDNTRFHQVIKRRHLRKDIQNKIGVRDWRFFEKTRNNISDKRNEYQKKMLLKIIPEDTKSGKFLICVFGIGECPRNADTNNPELRAGEGASGAGLDEGDENVEVDKDGNGVSDPENTDEASRSSGGQGTSGSDDIVENAIREATEEATEEAGEAALKTVRTKIIGQILQKFNIISNAVGLVNTLDMLGRIDKNITSGKLNSMVVAAKGVQASQAYALYGIMRDQQKSGDVTAEELSFVMEGLQGMEKSEAYDYFFTQSSSTVSAAASKSTFCDAGYIPQPDDYHHMCDDIKIGGKNGANTLQEMYDGPAFFLFREVIGAYRSARNTFPANIVADLTGKIGGVLDGVMSAVIEPIMGALGITELIEGAIAWVTDKIVVALGAGPILTGVGDPAGLTMNMIGQGAAYTAELNMRASGAAISTLATEKYLNEITAQYINEAEADRSLYERYLALDSPTSLASTTLFSTINTPFASSFNNFGHMLLGSFSSVFSLFTGRAYAASDSHGAADLAGLDTYAFPTICIEGNPMYATPQDMTNADDLGLMDSSDVTWQLLRDEENFWNLVYENTNDNNANLPLQVYNCATLDQRIQGGMGYTSGYKDDDGLDDSSAQQTNNQPTKTHNTAGTDIEGQDTSSIPCPSSATVKDGGIQDGYKSGVRYSINTCLVHGIRLNSIASEQYNNMLSAMLAAGHTFNGSGGFRSMQDQERGWNGGAGSGTFAKPGYSNHQFGTAVDIVCGGGGPAYAGGGRGSETFLRYLSLYPCLNWIHNNSKNYGLLLQCDARSANGGEIRGGEGGGCEAWHISPTGG